MLVLSQLIACASPGTLWGPIGSTELRTALYRIAVREGRPEMVILLSNGDFDCGLPSYPLAGADADEIAESLEATYTAACREGAQHVALTLYDLGASWQGAYPGRTDELPSADRPRLSRGEYYGIEEAYLVAIDGLGRQYVADEDHRADLGDGGTVELERAPPGDAPGPIRGWLSFPGQEVSGRFAAQPCVTDTSTLDILAATPGFYCQ